MTNLSPLEVSPGGEDAFDPLEIPDMSNTYQNSNGGQGGQETTGGGGGSQRTPQATSSSSSAIMSYGSYVSLPLVYLLFFIQLAFQSVKTVVGDPVGTFRELMDVNRQTNEILQELPGKQQEQRRELHYLHEEQVYNNDRVEDLRRRIQRLEERQRQREQEAALLDDPMQILKEYTKKDK